VVAKAPVAGRVKTRLGAVIGMEAAARVAAASLLDTLAACDDAFEERHLALAGDLRGAAHEADLRRLLRRWRVHGQRGADLGERLAQAHADVAGDGPTVQLGMDTPQVTAQDLRDVAALATQGNAVLGPAPDGGWWVLALQDAAAASGLAGVPMSRTDTFERTCAALRAAGQHVRLASPMRDVDTVDDAAAVASTLERGRFRRPWQEVTA
jgi:uncharacterized protein